jgi:hypothetical protein
MDEQETGFIPQELDGVPTDVLNSPKIKLSQAPSNQVTPVVGGLQIALQYANLTFAPWGTLGLVVRNENDDEFYLTCSHIAFGEDQLGTQAETVFQPAAASAGNQIGNPDTNGLLGAGGALFDAATIRPLPPRDGELRKILGFAGRLVLGTTPPVQGMRVMKVGAGSAQNGGSPLSTGVIVAWPAGSHVFPIAPNPPGVRLNNLIEIMGIDANGSEQAFAFPGDSGALIFRELPGGRGLEAIGLIVGIQDAADVLPGHKPHAFGQVIWDCSVGGFHIDGILPTLGLSL